ncbi:MAG: 6-phosphogluconolactonase [Candidatus Woesearchaeota archaeon]|jgi:6-phosphogluconolactonase|nr:6-phosphogluconolactonase [Candidatus Woesearchaeota archaeon]MDP7324485.1 6-phosphogluconolactonase [Candidatus Woesearchaeota archaeon]MDP7458321.1 6-phosphogluconolactonase [Candidatus Woesearchaeota archaeon]|tara:strand:+ start:718 stop:1419 length:702 start_codon:yes stop_codon:yes gene_type:complete
MILRFKNRHELAKKAKDLLMEKIQEAAKLKKRVIVALPGGRSVQGLFKELAKEKDEVLKQVDFFWVDERVVPLDDEESNFKLADDLFLKEWLAQGVISQEQIHALPYQEVRGVIVEEYNRELTKLNELLSFDIVILGVGEDSHTAAIYPQHSSVKNDKPGYIYLDDSPKPPPERITASRKLLENSRVAIAIFQGRAKQDALENYLDGSLSIEKCPIKVINKLQEHIVLTDLKE